MAASMPKFFIVGAPKCGTTSLYNLLQQNREVFLPPSIKEPNFFSSDYLKNSDAYFYEYIKKEFGASRLIETIDEYKKLYLGATPGQVMGDASVSYLFYPEVPQRIKCYDPEAKIIIMLRNPIERAYSHYLMDYNYGYLNSELADLLDPCSKEFDEFAFQQIVKLGVYSPQIERYFECFPRSQILVLLQEEFNAAPEATLRQVCEFLQVEPHSVNFERSQVYQAPRNAIAKRIMRDTQLKSLFLSLGIPNYLKRVLKSRLVTPSNKPPMRDEDREFLGAIYKQDVARLSVLLSRNLGVLWDEFSFSTDEE